MPIFKITDQKYTKKDITTILIIANEQINLMKELEKNTIFHPDVKDLFYLKNLLENNSDDFNKSHQYLMDEFKKEEESIFTMFLNFSDIITKKKQEYEEKRNIINQIENIRIKKDELDKEERYLIDKLNKM